MCREGREGRASPAGEGGEGEASGKDPQGMLQNQHQRVGRTEAKGRGWGRSFQAGEPACAKARRQRGSH